MAATDDRQEVLPFADGAGAEPVPFRLTARARREVAPQTLPALTVVPGEVDGPPDDAMDPHDPRPARARALRRSGRSSQEIAHRLSVAEDLVDGWCDGVRPTRRVRTRTGTAPRPVDHRARVAAGQALRELMREGTDVASVTLVAALATVADNAVAIVVPDPSLAHLVLDGLRRVPGAAERIRVRVGVPDGVARDLAAQRWASRLGLPLDAVRAVPWSDAPDEESVRLTLRLSGSEAAGVVLGWRDALAACPASGAPSTA